MNAKVTQFARAARPIQSHCVIVRKHQASSIKQQASNIKYHAASIEQQASSITIHAYTTHII